MLSLAKTLRQEGNRGEALPDLFKSFTVNGVRFRRGGLHLIAGQPGSYKTQLALALADAWKLPTLYFSNDSDETKWASSQLTDLDHIKWNFSPNPTLPEVEEELQAFNEVFGTPPVLVVVDVLMKMNYVEDSEHTTAIRITDYLAGIARDYSACVLLVHHASEGVPGNPVPPRSAVLQKVSQFPSLILNVAPMPWTGDLAICAVKNRHGKQDPSGKDHFILKAFPAQCTFEDMP
jgi:hypothetical protein